jgi:hypothetical protein
MKRERRFPRAYAVVNGRGPITFNGQLPIFWYRRNAVKAREEYGGEVVAVEITERSKS